MNPTREEALFALALDKAPSERGAFLDRECGDDAALRARLEALLAAHEAPDTVLSPRRDNFHESPSSSQGLTELSPPMDEAAGHTLGRYKLIERLGEGGFGAVWLAEQREPVRRKVALKIIKLGMDTKQVVARFEAERQALAMMDHPNIAKVLDAGTTDQGRPYFVMELVRGVRITDYCDQASLGTKDRLELFIKVCQAIQHAHQKGIIHRDIKPSNILVTLHDGIPVPKVIDFGIAKATQGELTDKTIHTQFQQFIGTPAYMSPEQAEMSGLDIDTRSDIYSLGVLLYELLAGSTPFDAKDLMASGIDAMRKTIREKEPPRPSTRLATLGADQLTTTAKRRSADTAKLLHQLKGDLDWIVMKCLEKDRSRRYETANGLAADITRHLTNEPVLARPPSKTYRVQKAIRRNKLAFWAGSGMALAMMIGAAVAMWQAIRATRAEASTRRERDVAARARQQAEAINLFLTEHLLFKATPEENAHAHRVTMEEVLDSAAEKLSHDPAFRQEPEITATLRLAIGTTYYKMGRLTEAEYHLRDAWNLRRNTLGARHVDTCIAQARLAECLVVGLRRFEEGEPLALEAWRELEMQLGRKHPQTVEAFYAYFGAVTIPGMRITEAERLGRELLVLRETVNGPDDYRTTDMLGNLAFILAVQGKYAEAEKYAREEQARFRRAGYADREGALLSVNNLALFRLFQGDNIEPEKLLLEAIPRAIRVHGPTNPTTLNLQHNLARVYVDQGRWAEADAVVSEVLPMRRKVTPGHENLARTLLIYGRVLVQRRELDAAEPLLQESLSILRDKYAMKTTLIAQAANELGAIRLARQDFPGASAYLTHASDEFLKPAADLTPRERTVALQRLVQYYQAVNMPKEMERWQHALDALTSSNSMREPAPITLPANLTEGMSTPGHVTQQVNHR